MKELTNLDNLIERFLRMVWGYLPVLVVAIITLLVGFWLANRISTGLRRFLTRRNTNPNIIPFLSSLVSILIKMLVLISVATKFGIETTSFVALLGGAGLAVGLALQGNLSNFASGVMILVFKPYKIGDSVIIGGHTGVVTEILIFSTVLRTPENRRVIIPNNSITSSAIINISGNGELRIELNFKVSGAESIEKIKQIILEVCKTNDLIIKDPPPVVTVNAEELSVSIFKVLVWTAPENTGRVNDYLNEEIRKAFLANSVSGP